MNSVRKISWKTKELGSIVQIKGGKRLPKGEKFSSIETPYKYIRISNMNNMGINLSSVKCISRRLFNVLKNYQISKNDLYLSIAGTIGRVGEIPSELDGAILTENAVKLITSDNFDKNFLILLLNSDFTKEQIIGLTKKMGQPKLAIFRAKKIKIKVPYVGNEPSFKEQKRIADKIDKLFTEIDKGIEKTKKALKNAKRILEGEINKISRAKVGENWRIVKLGELVSKITDGTHKTPFYTTSGIPFISTVNLIPFSEDFDFSKYKKFISTREYQELSKRASPGRGDLLISKCGTIGRTQVVRIDYDFSIFVGLLLIKLNKSKVNPFFLEYYFNTQVTKEELENLSTGATRATLPIKAMYGFRFKLPFKNKKPDLKEQERIVKRLDKIRKKSQELQSKYEEQLKIFEMLKQSVLNQAFQGKL